METIGEVCAEVNNYFEFEKKVGTIEVLNGEVHLDAPIPSGCFFRIIGSMFNDGVHRAESYGLVDEKFEGAVWLMKVPLDFIRLCKKIDEYRMGEKPSAFTSESFGGYSYTRATNKNGELMTWQDVFKSELKRWRKV